MNVLSYRGQTARVDYDGADQLFVGRLAGINDVVSFHGETVAELEAAFRDSVDDYIETCAKTGKAPEKPYIGD